MTRLKKKYIKEVIPEMQKRFGYKNEMAVPKILKVVFNIGTSRAIKEPKALEMMKENLSAITGQKPVATRAKNAISGFSIREGMVVGLKTTLRGPRMYEVLDKLINIALPRVRDFRGLKNRSLDQKGNFTIGISECTVFPEIDPNKVSLIHGLELCIVTSAETRKEGLALLKLLGFPFR